jgi:hypothetical protein
MLPSSILFTSLDQPKGVLLRRLAPSVGDESTVSARPDSGIKGDKNRAVKPSGECLLRKQRTTSCERKHGWRALVSTSSLTLSSFNPILRKCKDSYYSDMPDVPCITFVAAAQHIPS